MKLVHGQRRFLLSGKHAAEEIVVRMSSMAAEDMVHNAVRLWAAATVRRTALREQVASKVDEAESSSDGVSISVSEGSSASSTLPSATPSEDSCAEESSEGSLVQGCPSLPLPPPKPEEEKEVKKPAEAPAAHVTCPWFQALVARYPAIKRLEGILHKEGFDTKETIAYLTVEDMARMEIPVAVRRLLEDLKRQALGAEVVEKDKATSSNQC